MRHHASLLALALCSIVACAEPMPLGVQPKELAGTWIEVRAPTDPPGFSLSIDLAAHGDAITGAGTWQGEAHPGGIVSVSGRIDIASVILDLTLTTVIDGVVQPNPSVEHFEGTLRSHDDLEGQKTVGAVTSAMHLQRVTTR